MRFAVALSYERKGIYMKRVVSLLLCVMMLFGCASVLSGCAPKDDGAEIAVYLSDVIYDFDPTEYFADDNAVQVLSLLYEPLFALDDDGDLQLAAAKKYEVDEDEREIVIELRESYWSNGARVVAEDFIYAWRDRILAPSRANAAAPLLYGIENAKQISAEEASLYSFGASRSDLYEITIRYCEGADVEQLLKNLASVATAPVSQATVSSAPDTWSKMSGTCVTNGPFQLYSYDLEGEFTLTRNLGYHQKTTVKDYDDKVNPYKLVSFWAGEEKIDLTYSQIENNTVFYMGDATLAERAAHKDDAVVADALSTYTYLFNTENPLFADAKVRYALSLAIDRQAIADAVVFGEAATSFLSPLVQNMKGKTFSSAIISKDAQKQMAENLLSEVTLPEDKSFTLTVSNDEESLKIAELVKASWDALGFSVTVETAKPITVIQKDEQTKIETTVVDDGIQVLLKEASYGIYNFDCIGFDWQMYSYDPIVSLYAFTSKYNGNGVKYDGQTNAVVHRTVIGGWSSEAYDALIAEAAQKSGAEREAKLLAAEKMLVEQAPIVPVLFNQNFAFISSKLSRVKIDGFGFFNFTDAKQSGYRKYLPAEQE